MSSSTTRQSRLLAILLLVAAPLHAQRLDSLRTVVTARLAAAGDARIGFYFRSLVGSDSLVINGDERFHAASTMKVPVMIQVFRDVDAGRLQLRERIPVRNEFRSLADSSVFQLAVSDDSEHELYEKVGQEVELSELLELMITRSSNLATNILIDRVGAARIRSTLQLLGADSMRVLRGVEDGAAFRAGMNNTTTARGLAIVMGTIASADAASAQSCGEMMRILMRQKSRDGIPAGLPRRTRVANKTGEITNLHHDAAVVYHDSRARYILVILTSGLERTASAELMADLARLVHAYAVPQTIRVPYVPRP